MHWQHVDITSGARLSRSTQTNCPNATVIPLAERLAGGGNSHRGFGLNQAGPRDPVTGFPLGGSSLFLNNLELCSPETLPYVHDNISFALFWDAGNVFVDGRSMLDNLLRWRQKESPGLPARSHGQPVRFQLCQPCGGDRASLSDAAWPGALRFRVQSKPTSVSKLSGGSQLQGPGQSEYCVLNSTGSLPYFVPQHESQFNVSLQYRQPLMNRVSSFVCGLALLMVPSALWAGDVLDRIVAR